MLQLAAAVFLKFKSGSDKKWIMAISSYLNRLGVGPWQGQQPEDVFQDQFKQQITEEFTKLIENQFESRDDELNFKKVLSLASALVRGTIPKTEGQYYFTKGEKKNEKDIDFKGLETVGRSGNYDLYSTK